MVAWLEEVDQPFDEPGRKIHVVVTIVRDQQLAKPELPVLAKDK